MLTIAPLPTDRMRNARDPIDSSLAPRCESQWRLKMDDDGNVRLFCRDYYGGDGTPEREWNGLDLTWGFNAKGDCSVVDRDSLQADIATGGRLHALLERVHAGHSSVYDGQRYKGKLNEDADEASDEVEALLESSYQDESAPVIWDASEWLLCSQSLASAAADLSLTATSTEADIARAIEQVNGIAACDNIELLNVDEAIADIVSRLKDENEDEDEDD